MKLSPIQDKVACMVFAFDDRGRKEHVRALAAEVGQLERENAAMREAIREAHDALANVSTTFGRTPAQDAALAKLQPFITQEP
jgi:hypothetical protein